MKIIVLHGGQTGTDRGAHEAALDNGWDLAGHMPRDSRDELGPIPPEVARYLVPHEKPGYAARTEANVRASNAGLIVVSDASKPRTTPGTALTIDRVEARRLPCLIVDPAFDPAQIARWIWDDLRTKSTLSLFAACDEDDALRMLVAGPRESKWRGAQRATAELLRRVGHHLARGSQKTSGVE